MKLIKKLVTVLSGGLSPAQQYANRVLATSPLRYNKLNEGSGSAIVDSSGNGYTGTYTGVTWDGTLSPVGEAVPFWDGANDYGDLYSAAFGTAFNMDEFTVMLWFKVNSAGVWTDGTARQLCYMARDVGNLFWIRKETTNNTLTMRRTANSAAKVVTIGSQSDTGFVCVAFSASIAGGGLLNAGDVRAYKNGAQIGTTQTGAVASIGTGLAANSVVIGAQNTTPSVVFHGYQSQLIIWNSPMSADKLALMTG